MPDFWQFPTVSMGLGPIMSIYQARFNRYLQSRGLFSGEEPRSGVSSATAKWTNPRRSALSTLAARENLDNLDLGRQLQSPASRRSGARQRQNHSGTGSALSRRGLECHQGDLGIGLGSAAAADDKGLLLKRMEEAVDGDYQKYSVEPGSYTRKHFFGKYPELLELVNHLTDEQIRKLLRGGHDPAKVYAAYKAAVEHKGSPTVILAKTVKGYGLGEAGEGRNITHQQKKLNERELREFRARFDIPITDEEIAETPFYRPPRRQPRDEISARAPQGTRRISAGTQSSRPSR